MGKAKSLRARVSSYFITKKSALLPRTALLVGEISQIKHIVAKSEIDALLLEANLIRKLTPKYNVTWKDGKTYPLIEISVNDNVPLVRAVHKETISDAIYFGPYPTGSDLYSLLRFLRRIFPFASEKHKKGQRCLRSHLGLCPCPDFINYKKTIKHIISFLNGKRNIIQKDLTSEMKLASKNQNFEQAAILHKRLLQLEYVTSTRTRPFEYENNPNLFTDKIKAEINDLQSVLKIQNLSKIECYDISNTSGTLATGAQVTFVDGLAEKRLYRRYKIKRSKHSDVDMLREVVERRFKSHIELPNLLVLDGGRGQLSVIKKIFPQNSNVKLIALAKRLETIYTDNGEIINLSFDRPALHILQRIRDEAHRFSRSYHFWRRSKNMLTLDK